MYNFILLIQGWDSVLMYNFITSNTGMDSVLMYNFILLIQGWTQYSCTILYF